MLQKTIIFLRFKPTNENKIYKALQILDVDNKGYYLKDDLIRLMTTEGFFAFQFKKYFLSMWRFPTSILNSKYSRLINYMYISI